MRRILFVVIGLAMAALLGVLWYLYAPQLVSVGAQGALLSPNQTIGAATPLKLTFAEPMDHTSVEEHLTLPTGLDVKKAWLDDKTLVLTPQKQLTLGEVYEVNVPRGTYLADHSPLPTDTNYRFEIAGEPKIAMTTPSNNAQDVSTDVALSVTFDRPMIALQSMREIDPPVGFGPYITPETPGSWRFISTTTARFTPKEKWLPATHYEVTVPAGATTLYGEKITTETKVIFETVRPRVASSTPINETAPANEWGYAPTPEKVGASGPLTLTWNLPIDPTSIQQKAELWEIGDAAMPPAKDFKPKKNISIGRAEQATEEVEENSVKKTNNILEGVRLYPSTPLTIDTRYALRIPAGTTAKEGLLGTETDYFLVFRTAGQLAVTCDCIRERIVLNFTNPLADLDLKGKVTLHPEPVGWNTQELKLSEWERTMLTIFPALAPSTKYTLTVSGIQDTFGQTISTPFTTTFTTAPLDPAVHIEGKNGDFGIYEKDKPTITYFKGVNVKTINVGLAPISPTLLPSLNTSATATDIAIDKLPGYQSWSLPNPKKQNEWAIIPFDLSKKLGGKVTPGLYVLTASASEYTTTDEHNKKSRVVERQYFAVTDMALTLKYSGSRVLIWATHLSDGAPVAKAALTFMRRDGTQVFTGMTDSSGFFEGELPLSKFGDNEWNPTFWVTAESGADKAFVVSSWNSGLQPWNFGLSDEFWGATAKDARLTGYTYTERPVYRSGDTVYFRGILRTRDRQGTLNLPHHKELSVTIRNPDGTEVLKRPMQLSPFGSFAGEFVIDAKAPLGDYYLTANLSPEDAVEWNWSGTSFSVLEYRKPEYLVNVGSQQTDAFDKEKISATIEGKYYFGRAMSKAQVAWRAITADYFFNRGPQDEWYSFALEDSWCWRDCARSEATIATGTGVLDDTGKLGVVVPVDLTTKAVSQVITLEADVTDPNNQVVSNRISIPAHKAKVYVGVRTDEYAVTPGNSAAIKVIALDPKGVAVPQQKVTVKLLKREWNSVKKKNVDGEYYFENEPHDTPTSEETVETGVDGKAIAKILIPTGGEWRITAEAVDSDGRTSIAGTSLFAWSSTYTNLLHGNTDRLDVSADRPSYHVGDTAKLIVKSPYAGKGVKALVTVEREQVITKKVVDVVSNALPIEIPIKEEYTPNVFVSVLIVKPRLGETFDEQGVDTGLPAFRLGYTKLVIAPEEKKIGITLTTDKATYLPGEKVTATITTKNAVGHGVPAEVSLSAVDLSVLALTGFSLPDLLSTFYSEHGLGVQTAEMLSYIVERYKPGSKGGGGADPEMKKRGNFRDTAYWNPAIVTDQNGQAKVSFTLPDNLTTWKLVAVAATTDSRFGARDAEFIATKRVILRPVRPRFAVVGDAFMLGAIVQNGLRDTAQFTVTLTGTGFEQIGAAKQTIEVAGNGQKKVNFPVRVAPGTELQFTLSTETTGARDEVVEKMPVYAFGTPVTVATSGTTDTNSHEQVYTPRQAANVKLTTTISPTLASSLPGGLEYLATYPYGCAEQTASGFLGNIALNQLQQFKPFQLVDAKTLTANITAGLTRLYTFQRADGGFGYFAGSTTSYPYLTAYILDALTMTKAAGFAIDDGVHARARDYLVTVLHAQKLDQPLTLAERAYILDVLSKLGVIDENVLLNLYTHRSELPLFARSYLATSLNRAVTPGIKSKAHEVLRDLVSEAHVSSRSASFAEKQENTWRSLMNTNDRTNALVLHALVTLDPHNPLVSKLVRGILTSRTGTHWDTTQSTITTITALAEYLATTKELDGAFTATIKLGNAEIANTKFDAANILTKKEIISTLTDVKNNTAELTIAKAGTGKLYYDLLLTYTESGETIAPLDAGLTITRTMTKLNDPKNEVVTKAALGETYRVKLTVTNPDQRYFVGVESPLPAGLELIDTSFQTSQQALLDAAATCHNDWSIACQNHMVWSHTELRDDRVFLFAEQLAPGAYEYEYFVRATTPGTFLTRPARAFEMYYPENFGQTSGEPFEITEQ